MEPTVEDIARLERELFGLTLPEGFRSTPDGRALDHWPLSLPGSPA